MGVIDVLDGQHQAAPSVRSREATATERARIEREAAFHRLADLHLDRSYRLATAVLGDGTEAQDAVHDAFLVAWCKFDSLRDRRCFEAWFDRIVVNTCRDRMRHARRLQVRDLSNGPDIPGTDSTSAVPDEIVIRRALDRLKPDDRIVLALRFYRDLKVDDIAVAMGIAPRAAASRLHRALERLRRILDEDTREAAP